MTRRTGTWRRPVAKEWVAGRWWWMRRDCYGRVAAMAADAEGVCVVDVAVVARRGVRARW